MGLSDEQIKSIMVKEGKSRTTLVDNDQATKIINDHQKEGWKLVKKSELNGRTKLTFIK